MISICYGSSASICKPWRWARVDLIFSKRDIYINSNLDPLTKFTSSSRSTKLKYILPWSISQIITKTIPISMRVVISYAMKTAILSEFPNGRKAIIEQILASEERSKSKRLGLWESQSGIWVGKLQGYCKVM